jgi:hypothetical protein
MHAVSSAAVDVGADTDLEGLNYKVTNFFGDAALAADGPQGFLVEITPLSRASDPDEEMTMVWPHFHLVRQYQVFVEGDCLSIGKHSVEPFDFHYTDPSTPYGPIKSDSGGVKYFTLRPRADTGAYFMPGSRDKMTMKAGRNVVVKPDREVFVKAGSRLDNGSSAALDLIEPHEDGLASFLLTLRPHETVIAPEPAGCGGQYHLVARGSVLDREIELPPLSLIWVDGDDEPLSLTAGAGGAQVIVLQFPLPMPVAEAGAGAGELPTSLQT